MRDANPMRDTKQHNPTTKNNTNTNKKNQVGSHYHLEEANARLEMDRGIAYGKRLDIFFSIFLKKTRWAVTTTWWRRMRAWRWTVVLPMASALISPLALR